jgi:hypothetical protein
MIISAVLGADNAKERFAQTEKAVKWAFSNYEWPE